MSLWIKKSRAEVTRRSQFNEALNKVMPLPFEERRGRISGNAVSYKTFRWWKFSPFVVIPGIFMAVIAESRELAYENGMTPVHVWLADRGFFRHDTIRALNPAFDEERLAAEGDMNDKKWRFTGVDLLSEREAREFAALVLEKKRRLDEANAHPSK
jgi:hypothetical protein